MAKAGTIGRVAALSSRVRPWTVHTFHGHVLEGYFSAPVQRTFIEIERKLARRTDVLVAVSSHVRDALLELGIGRPEQFRVIPLGLDLSSCLAVGDGQGVLRSSLNLGPDIPLAGVISRLVPIKDHETLLLAMKRLPGVHLAVLGDGELRPTLEARVQALGLADRVHFVGWWTDVATALSDLDVVVLTSRNEGTPVSLIEGAAAARPVVATGVGGVPAVVEHGVTGYLARPGDPEHIASLISAVLEDPATARRMAEAARRHVRDRFGEDRLVAAMRDLYDELCSQSAGRGGGGDGERARPGRRMPAVRSSRGGG
jgi:glycosyltransferase involved in cell wall biosynthesis